MSEYILSAVERNTAEMLSRGALGEAVPTTKRSAGQQLAPSITWRASKQTFATIRLLVDRPLVADAYRAYAYFRWLDDYLDQTLQEPSERIAFVERQRALITLAYQAERPGNLTAEEQLVMDLIRNNGASSDGLRAYIDNMMAVMAFDAGRRGRLITQLELAEYTRWLATAVTEALHHFIGHGSAAPQDETRYLAVTAAHITHMLRDTVEDTAAGYFNIPRHYLEAHQITPGDIGSDAYRAWVQSRVQLARDYFQAGRQYMARLENDRCRLAGYAYIARFELVLDAIERDDYCLRADYPERKGARAGLRMSWSALSQALKPAVTADPPAAGPIASGGDSQ